MHRQITTTEAAAECGVNVSTISNWAARGYLTPIGLDEYNHPLYELGAVLSVARATRRRGIGTRRTV